MAALPKIEVNPQAKLRVEKISDEHEVVIVDNFLKEPEALVDFACNNAADFSIPENSYPGLLRDVDEQSMADVYRFIRFVMSRQFSFLKGGIRTSTYLSMTTLQPDELQNLQRLCHTDPRERPDRRNYAGLVYLFEDTELGGTGFYRWKEQERITEATALEAADPERALEFLQQHFPTYNEPARYMTDSNEIAELLCSIPAQFNRFVFYSGDVPHSAAIAKPELLCDDFSRGRLTLNCFASVMPR